MKPQTLAKGCSNLQNCSFNSRLKRKESGLLIIAQLAIGLLVVMWATGCGGGSATSAAPPPQTPSVEISPTSLTFGDQILNVASASQSVAVANSGTEAVSISNVSVTGDYSQTNNCPTSLAAATNCVVEVGFTPTATGTRTGTLSIAISGSSSAQMVSLTGTGISPTISPSSAALAPGGTVQFSMTAGVPASSGVTWSVNGIVGGSASVGTITADGLYTAPTSGPAMVVTVQGALEGASLSAKVAIIPPGTVSTTNNPQVAQYTITVPEASTVSIQFGTDTTYGLNTWTQTTPAAGGTVQIYVAGMRANTPYHLQAVVQLSGGSQFLDSDHEFTTGGLTASQLPALTATTTPGMTPNGGIELLDLLYPGTAGTAETLFAVDLSGNVIWSYALPSTSLVPDPIKLLPDGNFLINYDGPGGDGDSSVLEEVDLAGNVIWQMTAADLNTALAAAGFNLTIVGTHHDFAILPNGHLILIASEQKDFTNLTGYTGTTTVTGDVLIDLDTNRKPVWTWSEFDYLDVNRHPMNFPDWTHTNAVIYSASDGDLVVSLRHQYWVIKIDYDNGQGSGAIVWKLGWQGDFTLVGGTDPVDWFYAQHAPSFASSNTDGDFELTLFDNGDDRPLNGSPCGTGPTSPCYSTVPLLEINEPALTATIKWRDTLSVFSFYGGNAEVLPNGNMEFDECASGGTTNAASVYEVTQDPTNPQTVWQLQITGQNAYRAMRIPSLYPGVQW